MILFPMFLFFIGLVGFVLNRNYILLLFFCLEILLLAVTLIIILSGYFLDDAVGILFGIYIVMLAGAESSIGLGILVKHQRLGGKTWGTV